MSERIDTQGHGVKRRKDREFFDAQEIFPWISHYSPSSQEICFFPLFINSVLQIYSYFWSLIASPYPQSTYKLLKLQISLSY